MKRLIFLFIFVLSVTKVSWAKKETDSHAHDEKEHTESEKHDDHDGEKEEHKDEKGDEHGDEHGEGHGEGHGEEDEEANSAVGPDKGILEKSENGFKLSPEAIKSFELKTQSFANVRAQFPRPTLVEIKEDKFVYRIRDGWIKKIPVKLIKKEKDLVILELSQFKGGDQIIVGGTGFVRVSELVAEEGMAEGHSH